MSFVIEKGVPLPASRARSSYPFADMNIGDSFLVSAGADDMAKQSSKVAVAARNYGKRSERKFAIRKVEGGARVWRVE